MPRAVQTIDKVSFTLGVVGLLVTQLVATETPEFFWLYYLTTAPWTFLYRAIQYSMIKYHYFLIDFCYYANLACFAHPRVAELRGAVPIRLRVRQRTHTVGHPALAQLPRLPLAR